MPIKKVTVNVTKKKEKKRKTSVCPISQNIRGFSVIYFIIDVLLSDLRIRLMLFQHTMF